MSDFSPYTPRPTSSPPRRSILRTPFNIAIVVVIAVALAALLT